MKKKLLKFRPLSEEATPGNRWEMIMTRNRLIASEKVSLEMEEPPIEIKMVQVQMEWVAVHNSKMMGQLRLNS